MVNAFSSPDGAQQGPSNEATARELAAAAFPAKGTPVPASPFKIGRSSWDDLKNDPRFTKLTDSFASVIQERDMRLAAEKLRQVAGDHGLGVAMLVAHLHGLLQGHIPLVCDQQGRPLREQKTEISDKDPRDGNPYIFVKVPVREIRAQPAELIALGIMNPNPKTSGFIYHEDGLIGAFSLDLEEMTKRLGFPVNQDSIEEIFSFLEAQGILRAANVNSMQVHFKDVNAKRFIESQNRPVYVRGKGDLKTMILPERYDKPEIREYLIGSLGKRFQCNYCSCRELNPLELTFDSREINESNSLRAELGTVRNYMFGYTFAPFGDPREVRHFLAWDFPHINDVINNMDPQSYSFSDLIKLVNTINEDIERFFGPEKLDIPRITGVCNHWAGNTIYHQHYQFFFLPDIPIPNAAVAEAITAYSDVAIGRLDWPMPAYRIEANQHGTVADLMFVADKVASVWQEQGQERVDSYGNGILINDNTQNICVTREDGKTVAYFVPRLHSKIDTAAAGLMQKRNAGVLEVMGYFMIDSAEHMEILAGKAPLSLFKKLGPRPEVLCSNLREHGYLNEEGFVNPDKLKSGSLATSIALPEEVQRQVQRILESIPTSARDRRELVEGWLRDLSPAAERIEIFGKGLRSFLREGVVRHEQAIQSVPNLEGPDSRKRALQKIAVAIQKDANLTAAQTKHLLGLLNRVHSESADLGRHPLLSEVRIAEIAAGKGLE